MALPALLGMGALIGFFTRIVEWFVTRIAARFTNRLAGILVWTTLYLSLLVGLAVTFVAIISGVSPRGRRLRAAVARPAQARATVASATVLRRNRPACRRHRSPDDTG